MSTTPEFMLCRMEPRAPFHVGEREMALESTEHYIHSDTLFSGICCMYRLLYGREELESLLERFLQHDVPFMISSAFPYAGNVLLLPIPKNVNLAQYVNQSLRKQYKKLEFVSLDIFTKLVRGEDIAEDVVRGKLVQNGRVLVSSDESVPDRVWCVKEVPRVTIDRKDNASSLYMFSEVSFAPGCGLWFLMDMREKRYTKKVWAAIRLLGEEGIGGDRTCGKGLFSVSEKKMDVRTKSTADHFLTLSLYHPSRDELSLTRPSYYELVRRGGWISGSRGMRRKRVRMFAEGSVFNAPCGTYGELVDVTPDAFFDHRVYRYGYAFCMPMEVHA
ncbi:type III-A CRISPR-associated RAMP protein Csm4 [Methermicoccus shengliensis]|uniref:CRISPR system Cms protein Csm4 n=1 Tax=Methermicoccus shengliensis TaxID=660064 RepID=A0A832VN82_9EURY|nr:type III-A CRISPR-associated RAMP protein Csm4 [Methermicoccus shengliensis]MDI3488596.1 CRISPR-associated protein Csm4 [Methanosarcinales archaeon]MDN5294831.1 CRISPR-associated protein Csm4 [Methanosarcinales archaeon]HIH70051.1 type III-A CRISPR-associated RAMP protein Csm4 [Methermicoccus shengliensis]